MERCDLSVVGSNLHLSSFSDGLAILAASRNRTKSPLPALLLFFDNLVSAVHQMVAPKFLNFLSNSKRKQLLFNGRPLYFESFVFIAGIPMLGFLGHFLKTHFPSCRGSLASRRVCNWLAIVTMTTTIATEITCHYEAIGSQTSETLAFGIATFSSALVVAIVTTTLVKALVLPSDVNNPSYVTDPIKCGSVHVEQLTYSGFLASFSFTLSYLCSTTTLWTSRILSSYLDDVDIQLALALPSFVTICSLLTTSMITLASAIISRQTERAGRIRTLISSSSSSSSSSPPRNLSEKLARDNYQFEYSSLSMINERKQISTISLRSNVVKVLKRWWQKRQRKKQENTESIKGAENMGFFEAFDELKVEGNHSDEL